MEKKLETKPNILSIMAGKYNLSPEKFAATIKATVMRPGKDGRQATDEEFFAFLMVAHKYDLDPFTNEIYAFPAKKGGIVPVIGIDGYVRKICNNPQFDGYEISFSEEIVTPEGGKPCPEWCEIRLYRKGIQRPMTAREYIDELYRKSDYAGPWQTHTKRMLRHKTIIQAGRIAGFLVGVYDDDEAQRIIDAEKSAEPIKIPQAIVAPKTPEVKEKSAYEKMLDSFAKAKNIIGVELYYEILGASGYAHSNEINNIADGEKILDTMRQTVKK